MFIDYWDSLIENVYMIKFFYLCGWIYFGRWVIVFLFKRGYFESEDRAVNWILICKMWYEML